MNNNDRLIRIRYALDLKDKEMVEIFKLGDIDLTIEEVQQKLVKIKEDYDDTEAEVDEEKVVTNVLLESFLNGLIIYKRGKREPKPGEPERPALLIKNNGSVNNVMLKKLKIALALSSEDMLAIFKLAGLTVTKGELSALFRKEGHSKYVECGDKYARNFLKGMAVKYRNK